jgi:putative Holliday junction resolvase
MIEADLTRAKRAKAVDAAAAAYMLQAALDASAPRREAAGWSSPGERA